jgi:hypothetical protein
VKLVLHLRFVRQLERRSVPNTGGFGCTLTILGIRMANNGPPDPAEEWIADDPHQVSLQCVAEPRVPDDEEWQGAGLSVDGIETGRPLSRGLARHETPMEVDYQRAVCFPGPAQLA